MAALKVTFCDEFGGGFGWIVDEFMQRCSHALVRGRPRLGRSIPSTAKVSRSGSALRARRRASSSCSTGTTATAPRLAARLGVRHHIVPQESLGPFAFIAVKNSRSWHEVALWWPDRRVLVCADVLGTARYYRAGDERLAVHPVLRVRPPRRQLGALQPEVILCGSRAKVSSKTPDAALREALSTSRRRIPGQAASALRAWRASRPS